MYYEINEELCKRGHEQNHLITDYKPGSTTASYRAAVDAFAAKCEAAKQGCRPGHEAKLDALADRYARRLAAYYNNSAANNARHVSWFVAGPSNYNMRAHEKWSRREEKLREDWNAIQRMEDEISRAAGDPSTILSGDPEAVEQLQAKVERLTLAQDTMKAANVHTARDIRVNQVVARVHSSAPALPQRPVIIAACAFDDMPSARLLLRLRYFLL